MASSAGRLDLEADRRSIDENDDDDLDQQQQQPLLQSAGRGLPAAAANKNGGADLRKSLLKQLALHPTSPSSSKRRRFAAVFGGVAVISVLAAGITLVAIRTGILPWNTDVPDYTKLPPPKPGLRNPSYLARGRHGAVATEAEVCSQIGIDILRDGGKAIDAAISSALCVGVVNSFSSGIGGGGFMVIRPAGNATPISIDFRETSPTGSDANMYTGSAAASRVGGLAIGVPGELRGFEAAYHLHGGGVSWARIFRPNIELAKKYKESAELARRLDKFGAFMLLPETSAVWREIFAPNGQLARKGDTISRPAYAATLETLAKDGAKAFYTGEIAKSSIKTIKAAGGRMTLQDLASYEAIAQPAIKGTYRNRTIYSTHAPSAGPVLIHLLNILEHFDLPEQGRTPLNTHRFVEALKFAFARRTSLGDPAFFRNQDKLIQQLLSKSFARDTFERLTDNETHAMAFYNPEFAHHDDHGTTHLSVVDSEGGAAAITTTVNLIFGSRVMDPETGIIFNDEQDDFATPGVPDAFGLYPSPYNFPDHDPVRRLGKRPLSSTAATIIDDANGEFWLSLGGSGGSRIFGAVAQVLLNLDWGYDLQHAVEEPRVHDQLLPSYVSVESGMQEDLIAGLKDRGHNVTLFDINLGIAEVQGVMRASDGWLYAASDSRKNGIAKAY